jgi:O-antigen/teichoic acid export membrane protein
MINFKVISNKILKSPTSKMAAKFTGGNIIVALIGAASAIVYGRWIGPEILGEFNKYGILTGYLTIGIIFVDAAFQRHFPYYLGKNQEKKALEIAAVAHWWFLILFLGGAIIFAILASFNLYIKDFRAFWGWTVQILAFGIMTYGLYLGTLYRSNKDFLKLNKNMLVTAGIGILALPLVYLFNFFGFAFRKILQDLTNLYMLKKYVPFVAKPKFDKAILIDLFKISLPLQIPVYLDTKLLTASIGLIILNTQGEKALGVYAMALMFSGFLMIFSKSLNQIVTTKIALKYGSNDNIKDTFMYIIKPVLKLVLVGILLLLGFVITIDPTVAYFLPKYVDSILIAQILSLELILALIRSPFTLFTSSLMFKSLIIQRGLKVLLTFTLLLFFHDSLTQIALVIIFSNFLNVLYGYFVLYKTIKLK